MGTNYYLVLPWDKVHIGKSSAGWVFQLHCYGEDNTHPLHTLEDWIETIIFAQRLGGRIEDEYGTEHQLEGLLTEILSRSWKDSVSNLRRDPHAIPAGKTYDIQYRKFS